MLKWQVKGTFKKIRSKMKKIYIREVGFCVDDRILSIYQNQQRNFRLQENYMKIWYGTKNIIFSVASSIYKCMNILHFYSINVFKFNIYYPYPIICVDEHILSIHQNRQHNLELKVNYLTFWYKVKNIIFSVSSSMHKCIQIGHFYSINVFKFNLY